jgi:hypothetical protein
MRVALPRAVAPPRIAPELRRIFAAHNELATNAEAKLRRVPTSQLVSVNASSVADTPFVVPHNLNAIPKTFSAQMEQAGNCYATADDRAEWTTSLIKIRCNVSDAFLIVKVEAE